MFVPWLTEIGKQYHALVSGSCSGYAVSRGRVLRRGALGNTNEAQAGRGAGVWSHFSFRGSKRRGLKNLPGNHSARLRV